MPANYVEANFRAWLDRSRRNLGVDTIDLVQLHCPPSEVIDDDATYDVLDRARRRAGHRGLRRQRRDRRPGAERDRPPARRQRPDHPQRLPDEAARRGAARPPQAAGVGIIARVPLASGLLSGKYGLDTTFAEDDHRTYNRDGSAFDVGETFSGVDYATGVEAAQEFARLVADSGLDVTPAQAAIAWVCAAARRLARSSRARATPSRPGPTPPPARSARCPQSLLDGVADALRRADPRAGARALVTRDEPPRLGRRGRAGVGRRPPAPRRDPTTDALPDRGLPRPRRSGRHRRTRPGARQPARDGGRRGRRRPRGNPPYARALRHRRAARRAAAGHGGRDERRHRVRRGGLLPRPGRRRRPVRSPRRGPRGRSSCAATTAA